MGDWNVAKWLCDKVENLAIVHQKQDCQLYEMQQSWCHDPEGKIVLILTSSLTRKRSSVIIVRIDHWGDAVHKMTCGFCKILPWLSCHSEESIFLSHLMVVIFKRYKANITQSSKPYLHSKFGLCTVLFWTWNILFITKWIHWVVGKCQHQIWYLHT